MGENKVQFILQLINLAPEYVSAQSHVTWDFWKYQRLVSVALTVIMLAKSCVGYYFNVLGQCDLYRYDFYRLGKGWYAINPQKWFLFLIFTSDMLNACIVALYAVILANHDHVVDKWIVYEGKVFIYHVCHSIVLSFVTTIANYCIFYYDHCRFKNDNPSLHSQIFI